MRIALNARLMLNNRLEGIGMVTHEVMKRIVQDHPGDQFDYYFDRKFDPTFVHGSNVQAHNFFPVTRLPILIRYWLNHPVRKAVKERKSNVFFSPDGFIPLGMSTPKVSMVHDVAFLRYPEHLQPRIRRFYATWMPRFLAYTNHIITVSEFSKRELMDGYKIPGDKISVVYNATSEAFKPLTVEQQQTVREKYSKGKPFFLFLGAIHPRKNVITLVRAFHQFKSATTNDIQLVLAGRAGWMTDDLMKEIANSPFKSDIHLPGYVRTSDAAALTGSAEVMIYPSIYEGFGLPLIEAMTCGVPVICSDASSLPEVAGNAALLFEPKDVNHLTQHMEALTNNSVLRSELIQKGYERSKFFSWDKAAGEIYEILKRNSNE